MIDNFILFKIRVNEKFFAVVSGMMNYFIAFRILVNESKFFAIFIYQ